MPHAVSEWVALVTPYLVIAATLRWHFTHKPQD